MNVGKHGASVFIMGRRIKVLEAACEMLREEGIPTGWIQGDVRSSKVCERILLLPLLIRAQVQRMKVLTFLYRMHKQL